MTAANGFSANPDLVVDAEYFRFARPPAALTEAALDAAALSSAGNAPQYLSDSELAALLGDAASQVTEPSSSLQAYGQLWSERGRCCSQRRSGWRPPPNLVEWATASDPTSGSAGDRLTHSLHQADGVTYFTLTYARLAGAAESGNHYAIGDLSYRVDGSVDLQNWDQTPVPMAADTDHLPTLPSGYEWGCVRLPVATDMVNRGFLRFAVESIE